MNGYKWNVSPDSIKAAITWQRSCGNVKDLKESIDKLKAMMLNERDEYVKINLAKACYILNNLYLR
jgi:hypothetical protein